MHPVSHLQEMRIGAKPADGHFPRRRGGDFENQIQLDRHDEPRRLGDFRVELARPPTRVAGEHVRSFWEMAGR